MGADDTDYAVAFAIPVDTPGLTLVASPYLSTKGKSESSTRCRRRARWSRR